MKGVSMTVARVPINLGNPILLSSFALILLAARCGDEPAPATVEPQPAPVASEAEKPSGLFVEFEEQAGFGGDFHSKLTVKDGKAELYHKTFGFASDEPVEPVRYHKQLDAKASSALERQARRVDLERLPEPEPPNPNRLDDGPCSTTVTVELDGVRRRVVVHCESRNVLEALEPLIGELRELRSQILDENGYVEQGL